MSQYQEKIEEILATAVVDKTFSLEAVEAIKQMRDTSLSNQAANEQLRKENDDVKSENARLKSENTILVAANADVSAREKVVDEKERKQALDNLALTYARSRADEIKELFGIVFKNPVVREQVFRSATVPVLQGGYISNQTETSNETKNTEVQ